MIDTIKQALLATPWWVYLLFFLLVKRGVEAKKTQVSPVSKIYILPILFTGLSIYTLLTHVSHSALHIFEWAASLGIGTAIGYLMIRNKTFRFDKDKKLMEFPGSLRILVLVLLIFFTKYFFGYVIDAYPTLLNNHNFVIAFLGSSGLISGMFVGNMIKYMQSMRNGPFASLEKTA